MEDGPTLSAKRLKMDGALSTEFTCSVCLGFFQDPVILKCGHTLCSSCERKVVSAADGKKNCPECRLKYAPKTEVTPNIPVRNLLQRLPKEDSAFLVGETCPHIGNFTGKGENCFHCEKAFCTVCMILHLDKVQMEMKWIFSSFAPRLTRSEPCLETSADKAKKRIHEKLEGARAKVQLEIETMIGDLKRIESECLSDLNSYEEKETASVDCFVEESKSVSVKVNTLSEDLKEHLGFSVMSCSAEKIKALRDSLNDVDHKIYAMEKFSGSCEDFECRIDFGKLRESLRQEVPVLCSNNTVFSEFSQQSTEQLRFEEAMASFESLKEFYEMRLSVPRSSSKLMVGKKDENGKTVLHKAVTKGDLNIVRYLVENCGADIYQRDGTANGDSPIHTSARLNKIDIFKYLVEHDIDCATSLNKKDDTAFQIATKEGSIEVVKLLVDSRKVSAEDRDANGYTPLMVAVENNQVELVKYFVDVANADHNVTTLDSRKTILHLAVEHQCTAVLAYLAPKISKIAEKLDAKNQSCVGIAAELGYVEGFNILVDSNVAYFKRDMSNYVIHKAAMSGNVEIGRLLIEKYGATVDICNVASGFAPIHLAVHHNHPAFVALLLKANSSVRNIKCRGPPHESPLEIAKRLGFREIQELLQDAA